ncbi:hypothetical protein Prum_078240 [Phytohabitans rumicis]|uniref:SAM-dependent methyltransferase n=1 Tax=Phytohabitans rumicis TaxID=1076125 RepID=A0A6V8LAF0_9ACTN|nr:hypothetical protein Prum_078240 [Phytohabitans rumicis]
MSAVDLKSDVPHSARIYDYLLGGKDNFQADREAAAGIAKGSPNLPTSMRANRNYMARVAHYLAAECGFRQFLDVGTGLPTAPTCTRSSRGSPPSRGWSTSTTTRSCWCTPAPC